MMKFNKRDSKKMLKEVARLRGLSVSQVRGQIQDAITEARNSNDPDQQAEFQYSGSIVKTKIYDFYNELI